MKVRTDFVSNSSSCSFFVGLHTYEDVEAFKKIYKALKDHSCCICLCDDLHAAHCHEDTPLSEHMLDGLAPGNYVWCTSGDDSGPGYEYLFEDMKSIMLDGEHAFKLYADSWAHYTAYDELPDDECSIL